MNESTKRPEWAATFAETRTHHEAPPRLARDMTAEQVRLMHYRAAALPVALNQLAGTPRYGFAEDVAERAERIARATYTLIPQNETPHYRCPKCRAATTFQPVGFPAPTLAASTWRCPICRETSTGADLIPLTTPTKPPTVAQRRQREIADILAHDARIAPAFAPARKAACVCVCSRGPALEPFVVRDTLKWLHEYEKRRGGMTQPTAEAYTFARVHVGEEVQRVYERARGMP